MIKVTISRDLTGKYEKAAAYLIHANVKAEKSGEELLELIAGECEKIEETLPVDEIMKLEEIANTRLCYKAVGKDPHRYRNAAEAMLRRVVKGKGLYRINNVVDINNLVSITTGFSISTFDVSSLNPPLELTVSPEGTSYRGIGREAVNVEKLPAMRDSEGFFGNPTSDCERCKINEGHREILMCIYAFGSHEKAIETGAKARELLAKYCAAEIIGEKLIWAEENSCEI